MSIEVTEEELLDLLKDGAKMTRRAPAAADAPKESDADRIVTALRQVAIALVSREEAEINVAAPQVHVRPSINVEAAAVAPAPRKWRVTVTERDKSEDQRIKSLTFEAID